MRKEKKENKIKLLLSWAGGDKYYLFGAVICAALSSLSTVIPYYGFYKIIDGVYTKNITKELLQYYSVMIFISIILRYILVGSGIVLSHKGAYNTLYKVRCMVTEHMAKVSLGDLNDRNTGEIKTVIGENIEKLELFLAHHLPELVLYMTGPVVIFIYLCTVNIYLALVSLIPLVLAVAVMGIMFKRSMSMMDRANDSMNNLNASIIEYITGMKLIKALNMGSKSFKKYSEAIDDTHGLWVEMSKKLGPLYASYIIVLECGLLFLVPLGGYMFLKGSITASTLILFAFIGSLYLTEIRPLQEMGTNLAWVINGVTQVKEILDIPVFQGGSDFPNETDIAYNNVSFSYNDGNQVLKNCNLYINQGEKVAFVGASGAGKTTAVQLISRFFDVTEGEILIGGKNVKDINYEALLSNISIVFQKSFLTRDSVLDNIRMGMDATLDEVRRAAKEAQIDDFIMSLPDQYNTLVGSYGSRFSGGEKQRIALARAILKNAPILILDEATSAADPENQVQIDQAVHNLCKGKTVIIIAHRLGVVKSCDRVIVVEEHTFKSEGAHEAVIATNDYYEKAWRNYNKAREISYVGKGSVLA